jgi:hypothetical protein
MNQAIPCPYCGNIGYHMWAGSGGCPGAVPERERDAAAAVLIQSLTEQTQGLRFVLGQYALLCARAANALEEEFGPPNDPAYGIKGPVHKLIGELRKAAE